MSQTFAIQFNTAGVNFWPNKYQDAVLDYTIDIADSIGSDDIIGSASFAVAPSGAGELVASDLRITGALLTVTLAGGQPGRNYVNRFIVSMTDGRIFEFVVYLFVPIILPGKLMTVPPSFNFGTPITNP